MKKTICAALCLILLALLVFVGIYRGSEVKAPIAQAEQSTTIPVTPSFNPQVEAVSETIERTINETGQSQESILMTQWVDPEGKAGRRRITVVDTAFKYPLVKRLESVLGSGDDVVTKRISASVADHVLVKLRAGVEEEELTESLSAAGLKLRQMRGNGYALVEVTSPLSPDSQGVVIERLTAMRSVIEFAEPDYLVFPCLTPNDSDFAARLWSLNNNGVTADSRPGADIDAPEAWEILSASPNIIVAVTDTGVRYTHEDLASNLWSHPSTGLHGIDAYDDDDDPMDSDGHGTHVAGIVGASGNNGKGITGVTWDVKLMPLRFIGEGGGATSDAIRVIDYARENGARIINVSWGSNDRSNALEQTIAECEQAGVIIVAAAGNEGRDTDLLPHYPSSFPHPNIVSVASSNSQDILSAFSNYGYSTVDLVAPGSAVWSCGIESDSAYRYLSGTSMAAPHVSGALALAATRYPEDSMDDLIQRVFFSVDSGFPSRVASGGRLNLFNLLNNPDFGDYYDDFGNPYHIIGCQDYWCWYSSKATREADEDSFSPDTGNHSYWFKWVAPEDGLLSFTASASNRDVSVVAFRGSSKTSLKRIADNFAERPTRKSTLRFYAEKGVEYRFSLDSRASVKQILAIRMSFSSANDMFDDATEIQNSPFRENVTICGATSEPFERLRPHASVGKGRSVWVKWTADNDGPFTITTESRGFDTILAVYTGEKNSLTEIASNDDTTFMDYNSRVTFDAVAGTTYHIAIDSYRDEQTGSILLSGFPVGALAVHSAPQDTVSRLGQLLNFRVVATGDSLQYFWSKDGIQLPWPTDLPALQIRPVIPSSLGDYSVEVRSADQSETFSWSLSTPTFAPVVETEPIDPLIREGGVLAITPGIIASEPVTYQWFKGETAVTGATGNTLRIENVSDADAGKYYLVATNDIGTVRTRDFSVSIQDGAGLTWVRRLSTKDFMTYLDGLSFNGSIYLITKEGYLAHGERVDSLNFRRFAEMRRPGGIAIHGSKLVIYGNESDSTTTQPQYNHLLTSEDGENWTRIISNLPTGVPIKDFASNGTTAVALVDGKIRYSNNLSQWFSIPQGAAEALEGVESANGAFVAIRQNTSDGSYWLSSPDGVTWTERTDPNPRIRFGLGTGLDSVNGYFYIASRDFAGSGQERYSRSSDGIIWEHEIEGLVGAGRFAFHNGQYITVAGQTSSDGLTWSETFDSFQGSGGGTALFTNNGKIIRAGYQGKSVISTDTIGETPVIGTQSTVGSGNYQVHGALIFNPSGSKLSRNGIDWETAEFSMEGEDRSVFPELLSHDGTEYWTLAGDRLPGSGSFLFHGSDPSAMRRISVPFQLANISYNRLHAQGDHILLAGSVFRTSPDRALNWSEIPGSQDYASGGLSTATASGFILAKAESALISLNGGVSWQSKSLVFPNHRSLPVLTQISKQGSETLILDSQGYLLRSLDDGLNWSRIDLGEPGWKAVEHLGTSIYVLHEDGRIAMTDDRANFTYDGTLTLEGDGSDLTAFNGALFATVLLPNGAHSLFQGGAIAETDLRIAISGVREGSIHDPGANIDLNWTGSTSLGNFASVRIFLNGVEIADDPDVSGNFSIVAPGPGLNTLTIIGQSGTGLNASQTVRFFTRSKSMRPVTAISANIVTGQEWFHGALYLAMEDGRILRSGDGSNWDLCMHLPEVPRAIATTSELIAITTDRAIYTSHDGLVWETLSLSGISSDVYDFPKGRVKMYSTGDVLVANPTFRGSHFSENGRDWQPVPVSAGANSTIATFFKGLWISMELREEATLSIDGARKVLSSSALGFLPKLWAVNGSNMVIISSDRIHRTTDGKSWQTVGPSIQYPRSFETVDGYYFLTLGQFSPQSYMVSRDGLDWQPTDRIPDRITNGIWREGSESSLDGITWSTIDPDTSDLPPTPIEYGEVVDSNPHPTLISLVFQREGFEDIPIDITNLHTPVTGWEYGSFNPRSSLIGDDGTWYLFQHFPIRVATRSPEGIWSAPRSIPYLPDAVHDGMFYDRVSGMSFRTSPDLETWTTRTLVTSTTNDFFIVEILKFSDGIYFKTFRNLHKATSPTTFSLVYEASAYGETTIGQIAEFRDTLVRIGTFGDNRIQILDKPTGLWNPPPSYFSNGSSALSEVFEQNDRLHVVNRGLAYSTSDFTEWETTYMNVRGNTLFLNGVFSTESQSSTVYNNTYSQVFTLNPSGAWLADSEISGMLQLKTLRGKTIRHGVYGTWIDSERDASVAIEALSYEEVALNAPITVSAKISTENTSGFTASTGSLLKIWALPDGVNDYLNRIELAVVSLDGISITPDEPFLVSQTVQLPDSTNPGKFSIAAEISRPNLSFDDIPTNNLAKSDETLDLPARILTLAALGNGTIDRDNVGVVYANGALVSMRARAGKGASFSGWTGDSITGLSQITLRMDSDKSIAANFTTTAGLQVFTSGAGVVSGQSSNGLYPVGGNASLTAVPDEGWSFAGWSGASTGTNPSTTVVMDEPKALYAKFEFSLENWKESHFSGVVPDPSSVGDNIDSDGDGRSNWIEYLHGSDPIDAKSTGVISSSLTDDHLTVIFLRNSGSQGATIVPQGSIDVSDWNSHPVQERVLSVEEGIETVEARLPREGKGRAFIRMRYAPE